MIPDFRSLHQRLRVIASRAALCERFLAFDDRRANLRHLSIQRHEVLPFIRNRIFMVNCFDGALGSARVAIDAGVGINEKHLLALAKAVGGAYDHTVGVLAAEAGFCHYKSHECIPPTRYVTCFHTEEVMPSVCLERPGTRRIC
jgi:hypothetical protein